VKLGRLYIGKIHNTLVKYKGFYNFNKDGEDYLHQFEYVPERPITSGYGQTDEQVKLDDYQESVAGTILFGGRRCS
jgi:hypothetical protein